MTAIPLPDDGSGKDDVSWDHETSKNEDRGTQSLGMDRSAIMMRLGDQVKRFSQKLDARASLSLRVWGFSEKAVTGTGNTVTLEKRPMSVHNPRELSTSLLTPEWRSASTVPGSPGPRQSDQNKVGCPHLPG